MHKTQSMGKHAVYPRCDKMLWDAYFGLEIQLITDNQEDEHLFPDFAKNIFQLPKTRTPIHQLYGLTTFLKSRR